MLRDICAYISAARNRTYSPTLSRPPTFYIKYTPYLNFVDMALMQMNITTTRAPADQFSTPHFEHPVPISLASIVRAGRTL